MKKFATLIAAALCAFVVQAQVITLNKAGHWNVRALDAGTATLSSVGNASFYNVAMTISVADSTRGVYYGRGYFDTFLHTGKMYLWTSKTARDANDSSKCVCNVPTFSVTGGSTTLTCGARHSSGMSFTMQYDRAAEDYSAISFMDMDLVLSSAPFSAPTVGSGSSIVLADAVTGSSDTTVRRNSPDFSGTVTGVDLNFSGTVQGDVVAGNQGLFNDLEPTNVGTNRRALKTDSVGKIVEAQVTGTSSVVVMDSNATLKSTTLTGITKVTDLSAFLPVVATGSSGELIDGTTIGNGSAVVTANSFVGAGDSVYSASHVDSTMKRRLVVKNGMTYSYSRLHDTLGIDQTCGEFVGIETGHKILGVSDLKLAYWNGNPVRVSLIGGVISIYSDTSYISPLLAQSVEVIDTQGVYALYDVSTGMVVMGTIRYTSSPDEDLNAYPTNGCFIANNSLSATSQLVIANDTNNNDFGSIAPEVGQVNSWMNYYNATINYTIPHVAQHPRPLVVVCRNDDNINYLALYPNTEFGGETIDGYYDALHYSCPVEGTTGGVGIITLYPDLLNNTWHSSGYPTSSNPSDVTNASVISAIGYTPANDASVLPISLSPRSLFVKLLDVSNSGTANTKLDSSSLPVISTNDGLSGYYAGSFAGSINNKRLKIALCSASTCDTIFNSGNLGVTSAADWRLGFDIISPAAGSERITVDLSTSFGAFSNTTAYSTSTVDLNTNAAGNIKLFGVGGASNEVTMKMAYGSFVPTP